MKTDSDYMSIAMQLALRAQGFTSPNPMVGCVIVKNHRVIAQGFHARCGAQHAEIVAIKRAGSNAHQATLYVTLEPCAHFGRTPPCVDAIIKTKVKRVVIGMQDPNPLTNGQSIVRLRRAGIKVDVGILQEPLQQLNAAFIKYITQKMPLVVAKIAQTIDGKIATCHGESKWITSEKSRRYAREQRNRFDAILIGSGTLNADDPRLDALHAKKRIKKIILDTNLTIKPSAHLFQNTSRDDIWLVTSENSSHRKKKILNKIAQIMEVPLTHNFRLDLKWLFQKLAEKEITSVLIEGGATVIGEALNQNLVDQLMIYIAPKILGDEKALSSVVGIASRYLKEAIQLQKLNVTSLGEDILLEAYVHRNR